MQDTLIDPVVFGRIAIRYARHAICSAARQICNLGGCHTRVRQDTYVAMSLRQHDTADDLSRVQILQLIQFLICSNRSGGQAENLVHLIEKFTLGQFRALSKLSLGCSACVNANRALARVRFGVSVRRRESRFLMARRRGKISICTNMA